MTHESREPKVISGLLARKRRGLDSGLRLIREAALGHCHQSYTVRDGERECSRLERRRRYQDRLMCSHRQEFLVQHLYGLAFDRILMPLGLNQR